MSDCNYISFLSLLKEKGMQNPWEEVANKGEKLGTYYSKDTQFICSGDKEIIEVYNNSPKRKNEHKFITDILPGPFYGNIFKAKIIVLTLNPGFIEEVNHTLYNYLNAEAKSQITQSSIQNLRLQGEKIFPNDAVNFIDDRYWSNKTKNIRDEIKSISNKDIAVIQYIGYQSNNFNYSSKFDNLESVKFMKTLIRFLQEKRTDKFCFIIARPKKLWETVLNNSSKNIFKLKSDQNSSISSGNIKNWDELKDLLLSNE